MTHSVLLCYDLFVMHKDTSLVVSACSFVPFVVRRVAAMQQQPTKCGQACRDWERSARARLGDVDPELFIPRSPLTGAKDVYDASVVRH